MLPIFAELKASEYVAKYGLKVGKVLLVVGLAIGYTLGCVHYGKNEAYREVAEETAKKRSAELAALAHEAMTRQPVVEKAVKDRAELQHRVDTGMEKLNDAVNKAGAKSDCDLTADELQSLIEIN